MALVAVDDLDDVRLADYAHLRSPSTRQRTEQRLGLFTVEGWLSLEALVASPFPVRSVLVAAEQADRALAAVPAEVPVFALPPAGIRQVTGVDFHRGVVAVAERPPSPTAAAVLEGARRPLLVEGVNDHENLGALFRNAAAFGVDAVVLDPTCADPLYRRATRVSVGHVLRIPFGRAADEEWPALLDDLHAAAWTVLALTPDPAAESLWAVAAERPDRWAVLVGAEGPGLRAETLGSAVRPVRIPMASGVDSVNVATAAAIALAALDGASDEAEGR